MFLRRRLRWLAAFTGLAVMAGGMAVLGVPAAFGAVTLPDSDPFYSVPGNVGTYANGAVLDSRQIDASAFSLPLLVSAWQVKYKTTDDSGTPTATVTTILVPLAPWLGSGPRPLVSYQTAEDGVGTKCSPSYALRAGAAAGGSNSEAETPMIGTAMLLNGWAIAAPDYEGPNSAFIGGLGEGQAVLDGVRAAQAFHSAGLSSATPTALWGYSGGSLASAVAAQIQGSYAPELSLKGVALGGLVADVNATLHRFSGSPTGGDIVLGLVGAHRSYPSFDMNPYLNDKARADMANSQTDCANDATLKYPFLKIEDLEAYPGAVEDPAVQAIMLRSGPDGIAGTPREPVYDYHATLDELAPLSNDRQLMTRYCGGGVKVQHVEDLLADHITEIVSGALGAMSFLNASLHNQATPNSCATIPAN